MCCLTIQELQNGSLVLRLLVSNNNKEGWAQRLLSAGGRQNQGGRAAERGEAIVTTRGRRSRGELFLRTSFRWFSIIEDDLFVPIALPWLIRIILIWFYNYWNYFKYVFNEMLCACHHCKYCENMANEVMGQKLGVFQVNWPLVPFNCLSGPLLQLQLAVFVSEVQF